VAWYGGALCGKAWQGPAGKAWRGIAWCGAAGVVNLITKRAYRMADTTGFEKAWRHRCKGAARHCRSLLKRVNSRLNRREGRLNLMDACNYKLNERNVT
jgi:hypothetical protein